ncbi:F-box/kelch-repeat protein [Populus alba x Populus x berolinensis]|nr:F-box/kelch-repeat protein [Populus alba x Populus x berolinensis]
MTNRTKHHKIHPPNVFTHQNQTGKRIPEMESENRESEATHPFPTNFKNSGVTDPTLKDPPMSTPSSSSSSSSTSPGPSQKQQNNDHNLSPPQTNKKRTKKTPPTLPNLPHELIIEILSRLPAKSLIKFRCVSKSFKSLISNPQFIKTHLERVKNLSRNGPDFSPEIVISSSEPLFRLKSCSLYSVYNNPVTDAVVLDYYLLRDTYRYDWVVGSCDGLLCLGIKQDFVVLWNPSTRVFNRLPGLGFAKKLGSYTVFGFGYDSQIDDYKVLAMFCFLTKSVYGGSRYVTRIKVCALKGECWRRLEDFGLGLPYDVSGKHVDGKLCWPVMPEGSIGSAWSIVAFDLAQEMFEEVVQPDYGAVDYERVLGVLQGWLCVMCNYQGVRADVWVLKEFGVRDSWTKLFSIPYLDPLWFHYSVPLCIDVGGEVLLEYKSVLVIYNPKHGTFRYPVMNGASSCIEADVYIQSLVSPVVDGQV